MKKLIKTLFVLFLMTQISACAQSKTIIETKEEWETLFDLKNYANVKIIQKGEYKDLTDTAEDDMNDEIVVYSYDNILQIVSDDSSIYYEKDIENSKLKYYTQIGKDLFTMDEESFSSEEIEVEYERMLSSYILGSYDFASYYSEAEYDENRKCYSFVYNDVENDYSFDVEVYPKDSYLSKIVTKYSDESYTYTLTTEFKDYGKVNVKLPTINNTVSSDEEWDNLFDINKYKNCIVYKDKGTYAEQIEVEENLIHYMKFTYETEELVDYYFENTDDPYLQNVTEINEDGNFKSYTGNYGNIEGVMSFEDYYLVTTFEKDYKGYFRRAAWVNDHYEFSLNNGNTTQNISIYVSDGYLVTIMIEETDGENINYNQIDIHNFGSTKFSIPSNN